MRFACSSIGTTRVAPSMSAHFFGHAWSSKEKPARPARSNSRTVRMMPSGPLKKPVSASTMSGISTAAATLRAWLTTSIRLRNPRSGNPSRLAVVALPNNFTAGKPACSTSRAVIASYAPGAIKNSLRASSSRNFLALVIAPPSASLFSEDILKILVEAVVIAREIQIARADVHALDQPRRIRLDVRPHRDAARLGDLRLPFLREREVDQ